MWSLRARITTCDMELVDYVIIAHCRSVSSTDYVTLCLSSVNFAPYHVYVKLHVPVCIAKATLDTMHQGDFRPEHGQNPPVQKQKPGLNCLSDVSYNHVERTSPAPATVHEYNPPPSFPRAHARMQVDNGTCARTHAHTYTHTHDPICVHAQYAHRPRPSYTLTGAWLRTCTHARVPYLHNPIHTQNNI
jgi:hypothetical protein